MVLGFVLTLTSQGQEGSRRGNAPHDTPTIAANELIQLYDSLRDLSVEEQREQMWGLSSKTKAALWKYNLELYIQKHTDLGQEERQIVLDGVQMIASPAWFDIQEGSFGYDAKSQALNEYKRLVQTFFQPDAVYSMFLHLGEGSMPKPPMAAPTLTNPSIPLGRNFTPRVEQEACTCADWYECWYYGADCFVLDCSRVFHCGFFDNEMCIGKCKLI